MNNYTEVNKSRNALHRIARHDEQEFSKDSIVNVMEKFVKTVSIMDETIMVPCRLMDQQIGDSNDIIAQSSKDSTTAANQQRTSKRGAALRSKNVNEFLHSAELFNLYNTLNALKNELLWTGNSGDENGENGLEAVGVTVAVAAAEEPAIATTTTATTTITKPGHVRRISTASLLSAASLSNISDSESDVSNENDSGLECEAAAAAAAAAGQQLTSSDSSTSSEDSINGSASGGPNNVDKAIELSRRCRRHLNGLYQCLEQMTEAANYLTARYQSDFGPE